MLWTDFKIYMHKLELNFIIFLYSLCNNSSITIIGDKQVILLFQKILAVSNIGKVSNQQFNYAFCGIIVESH